MTQSRLHRKTPALARLTRAGEAGLVAVLTTMRVRASDTHIMLRR